MDKNVSGVDLEELQKAREALDKERGVETDPNLYSDYNPNRDKEEQENASGLEENVLDNYDNITNVDTKEADADDVSEENNDETLDQLTSLTEETLNSDASEKQPDETDSKNEQSNAQTAESEENLSKFDIFAAFEVKENAPQEEAEENIVAAENQNDESDLTSEASVDDKLTDVEIDKKLEKIDNAEDLENLLNDLLSDIDEEEAELDEKLNNSSLEFESDEGEEILNQIPENSTEEEKPAEIIAEEERPEKDSNLTGINIEPNFDDVNVTFDEEVQEETENSNDSDLSNDDISENVREIESNGNPIESIGVVDFDNKQTENLDEKEQTEETQPHDEDVIEEKPDEDVETEIDTDKTEQTEELIAEEPEETENVVSEDEETSEEKNEADEESDESNEKDESASTDNESGVNDYILSLNEDNIDSLLGKGKEPEPVTIPNKNPVQTVENASAQDTEVITDYSQLRDIFQQQLKESEVIDTDEFKKKFEYKNIDEFKFIDEIASDGFKQADKFSYILGRNEKNEMIYGNFKEHNNLAVFGKNDSVINSFLNSMILSLCLKNSIQDVNFVLLDSDINSLFDVYNKSSYLYFNRIAKTNKEILDTLIEVSKEVDARYEKFAKIGVKNIEAYNEIVVENSLEAMPQVVLVFNNYTSASQATNHDRINACLYQILKYGRIAGIYAVVAAKLPIDVNQINYSLSSRISFKSDEDSTYTVGDEGVEFLPSENDAIYYNIASNKSEHIKCATVSDIELDIIIKDLED